MIRRLVLDVLKPHEPGMIQFASKISEIAEVDGVTAKLVEMDEHVRTIRVAIEGDNLDFGTIETEITDLGGSIHSIDEVSCGEIIIEDPWIAE